MDFLFGVVHSFVRCLSSSAQNSAFISVGAIRDVQALARHSFLQQTQKYTDMMSGTSTTGKKI
jgi:hypothetical protein